MSDNPFQPPSSTTDPANTRSMPSNAVLWRAYLLAPGVAPIPFVLLLLLVGGAAPALGIEVNPASFLVLPLVALTVGFVVCYVVAGAIGMPIAFYLRNRSILNGYTIHSAALCWVIFFSMASAFLMSRGTANERVVSANELLWGMVYLIQLLISKGADPLRKNAEGETAYRVALEKRMKEGYASIVSQELVYALMSRSDD